LVARRVGFLDGPKALHTTWYTRGEEREGSCPELVNAFREIWSLVAGRGWEIFD
jgi:hypothetical protein